MIQLPAGFVFPVKEFVAIDPADGATITVRRPQVGGLTKRELVAAMALQGLLANEAATLRADKVGREEGMALQHVIAAIAIDHADALLNGLDKLDGGTP